MSRLGRLTIGSERPPKSDDNLPIGTRWRHGDDLYVAVETNTLWEKQVNYEPNQLNEYWIGRVPC